MMLPDGRLRLLDRTKEMVNRGGASLSPSQIEQFILKCRSVMDVCVAPYPHPDLGEAVGALIVARPGFDLETVSGDLRAALPPGRRPDRIKMVDHVPRRRDTGKLDRLVAQEIFKGSQPQSADAVLGVLLQALSLVGLPGVGPDRIMSDLSLGALDRTKLVLAARKSGLNLEPRDVSAAKSIRAFSIELANDPR